MNQIQWGVTQKFRAPNGRIFNVERKNSRTWEGWWDDDNSMIYEEHIKAQMLADALQEA